MYFSSFSVEKIHPRADLKLFNIGSGFKGDYRENKPINRLKAHKEVTHNLTK